MTHAVTLAKVEEIVIGILRGQNVAQYNEFILSFIETDAAWEIAMALSTNSTQGDAQYFGMNMLYTKIKKHWAKLDADARMTVLRFLQLQLQSQIASYSEDQTQSRVLLNRICLSLAAVSCRLPNETINYVNNSLGLVNASAAHAYHCRWGLELLSVLPDEIASFDASRALRVELTDQMNLLLPNILLKLDEIANSLFTQNLQVQQLLMRYTLILLRCWLPFGITLSQLYQSHRPLFTLLAVALQSADNFCIMESCNFLSELVVVVSYPREAVHDSALRELLSQLIASGPQLLSHLQSGARTGSGAEDAAVALCNCFNAIAYQEMEYIASLHSQHVDFLKLTLSLLFQLQLRKLFVATFDMWIAIADIPVAERHPYVRSELFVHIVNHALVQLAFPVDYNDSWDSYSSPSNIFEVDIEEDFNSFRDYQFNGLDEVLSSCVYALNEMFFQVIGEKVQTSIAQAPFDWKGLEAITFVVRLIAATIKASFLSSEVSITFLMSYFELLLSIPIEFLSTRVEFGEQVAEMFRSYTFLFVSSTNQRISDIFLRAIQMMLTCALHDSSHHSVALSAARCIQQFCTFGYAKFLQQTTSSSSSSSSSSSTSYSSPTSSNGDVVYRSTPLLIQCVQLLGSSTHSIERLSGKHDCFVVLVQGYAKVVSYLSPSPSAQLLTAETALAGGSAGELIAALSSGLVHQLQHLIVGLQQQSTQQLQLQQQQQQQQRQIDVKHCQKIATIIKQIIKFGHCKEQVSTDPSSSAPVIALISQLLPIIDAVKSLSHMDCYEPLADAFIGIWTEMISALNQSFSAYLSVLGEFLMATLNRRVCRHSVLFCIRLVHETFSSESIRMSLVGISDYLVLVWDSILSILLTPLEPHLQALQQQPQQLQQQQFDWLCDPPISEQFLLFVYSYALLTPELVYQSRYWPAIGQVLGVCLRYSNEKGTIKAMLQVVQVLFGSAHVSAEVANTLLSIGAHFASQYLCDILLGLDGRAPHILRTNLIDAMYAILCGFITGNKTAECKLWMNNMIFEQQIWQKIDHAIKPIIIERMFQFATDNKRRFKSLMLDIAKISNGEDTDDCLLAYLE